MSDNVSLESKRIAVIEKYLAKEESAKLAENMNKGFKYELISIFCGKDFVTTDDIVGYFADDMKLGSSILSSFNDKPSKSGVLFLKDRFYYRKGMFSTPVQMSYDDVRYVDKKFSSLVVYSLPSSPIVLSGISYSDPNQMPILFSELRDLNEKMEAAKDDPDAYDQYEDADLDAEIGESAEETESAENTPDAPTWTCECGRINEGSFNFCPNCGRGRA